MTWLERGRRLMASGPPALPGGSFESETTDPYALMNLLLKGGVAEAEPNGDG